MDTRIIIDKEQKNRFCEAADKFDTYCRKNKITLKNILVIFSNNVNFIKEVAENIPKGTVVINVTENLSEQHIIGSLKYVADICFLRNDVNTIVSRIIKVSNQNKIKVRI